MTVTSIKNPDSAKLKKLGRVGLRVFFAQQKQKRTHPPNTYWQFIYVLTVRFAIMANQMITLNPQYACTL